MDNKTFRKKLSERSGRSLKDLDALVGALKHLLEENALEQRSLAIPGVGTFVPVKHDEKVVTDLTTGRRMLLPPEITLEFYPGSSLRKKIDPTATAREIPLSAGGLMTLPAASAAIAGISEIGNEGAESFLKNFFETIEEADAGQGDVTVKGIGEFRGLSFRPDAALAEEINQPFAMFEPVELETDESALDKPEEENPVSDTPQATDETEGESSEEEPEATDREREVIPALPPVNEETIRNEEAREETESSPEEEPARPRWRRKTFAISAAAVMAAFAGGFACGRLTQEVVTGETVRTDTVTVRATVIVAAALPEPEPPKAPDPIYDTVTSTRYLASRSRQYYGRMEYWVYIYKANERKLGDPDRIKPGTRVEIPPFERYAVSRNDTTNLAAARRMSREIYAKYGK